MPIINRKRRAVAEPEPADEENDNDVVSDPDVNGDGDGDEDGSGADALFAGREQMVKNVVRMALASEYSRTPIRRADIIAKAMPPGTSRQFKQVLTEANEQLRKVFGMELRMLPQRERVTIAQKRAAVNTSSNRNTARTTTTTTTDAPGSSTQASSQAAAAAATLGSSSTQAYILTSTLPLRYRTAAILPPSHAPSPAAEGAYAGLVSFVVGLVYLSPGATLSEARLEKHLKRVNADEYALQGERTENVLKRMAREGYIVKIREQAGGSGGGGEESVEYIVGPRGKVEIGPSGVAGLVRTVYAGAAAAVDTSSRGGGGGGDDDAASRNNTAAGGGGQASVLSQVAVDELERRLVRSLGEAVAKPARQQSSRRGDGDGDDDGGGGQGQDQSAQEAQATAGSTAAPTGRAGRRSTYRGTARGTRQDAPAETGDAGGGGGASGRRATRSSRRTAA